MEGMDVNLPLVLSLGNESQDVVVVLALPLLRANGGNCLKPDEVAQRPVRYRQRWRDVRNAFGEDTRQIAVIQPELTLRFAYQNSQFITGGRTSDAVASCASRYSTAPGKPVFQP